MDIYHLCMAIFELLTVLVLIALFIGHIVLNRRKGDALRSLPFKAVLASLLSFSGSGFCLGVYNCMILGGVKMTAKSDIAALIAQALMLIAVNLLFYTFFEMIHAYGEQSLVQIKMWPRVRIFHWVVLGLFTALSIVDWCWDLYATISRIQFMRRDGDQIIRQVLHSTRAWNNILTVRWIIFWVASWEILGAFIFMGIQVSTRASHMRMSTYFAVISGSLFFGLNGLWAVWSITAYLPTVIPPTTIAITVREGVQFFFATGTYLGVGLCFWRFPSQVAIEQEDDPSVTHTRLLGSVETDSRKFLPEADSSRQIMEADASQPVLEADGSNPILEADSTAMHEKP